MYLDSAVAFKSGSLVSRTQLNDFYSTSSSTRDQIQGSASTSKQQRSLSIPFAKHLDLWGYASAVVILGDYSGWSYGLHFGWINCILAFTLATIMYWLLGLSIAEMTCSLPFSGGPATFAHAAFGHGVSAFNGLTYALTYCIVCANNITMLGRYASIILGIPDSYFWLRPLLWIPFIVLLLLSNNEGRRFFRCATVLSGILCVILLCYTCLVLTQLPKIDISVYPAPVKILSVVEAFPYMLWFYLGVECIPMSAEECLDITRVAPQAIMSTLTTLTVLAIFLLLLLPGSMGSSQTAMDSNQPVVESFFFNLRIPLDSMVARIGGGLVMMLANYAAGHGAFYVSARHVYTLARAGYLPVSLANTVQGTPRNTNWMVACISYFIALLFLGLSQAVPMDVDPLVVKIVTWFGCLSYLVEMIVSIRLRVKMPQFPRPWKNPAGVSGAVVAALISAVGVLGAFAVSWKIYGIVLLSVIVMALMFTVYYFLFARTRLLMCPEREYINAQLTHLFLRKMTESISIELQDA